MGTMQVTKGIGATIAVADRSYTKTNAYPVVFIPAIKGDSDKWYYWAVLGRTKYNVSATVTHPEYTQEFSITVNGRPVYVLTLDNGAFQSETLSMSGPGIIPTEIQMTPSDQWYDLTKTDSDNEALKEAELLLLKSEQYIGIAPRTAGGGLSNSKLAQANAAAGDVVQGKTFYAGDKKLKVGTIVDMGVEQIGGDFAWDNDYVYIQPIPEGYYHNDNPVNTWNPRVKVQKQKMFDLLGGNHGGWSTTIDPGGSVAIPAGYHNGAGRVNANNVQSQLKSGTVSTSFAGNDWAQRNYLPCAGTVIGITAVRGTRSTWIDGSINMTVPDDGRGVKFSISGNQIVCEADARVSTQTIWIDYVYI